ncbi:MAG: hypothetical protein IPL61_23930 [Myxococcales bacterium]|nr:hypothetical protein [Myxococcales bacterium]
MMNRLTLAVAAAATLCTAACVQQDDGVHPVAKVLPTANDVRIKLPDSAGQAMAAVGDTAQWYVTTRDLTRTLNGGTAFVLVLVHTIVQFPPTSVDGATAVWGPHHEALDPAEWRLTVTELADGTYAWHLDGRNRADAANPFETLIDGNAGGDGTGAFQMDFDAAERVNPRENDGAGQLGVTYDLGARQLDMDVDKLELRNGGMTPVHYDYTYGEAADGAGDMVFGIYGDTDDAGDLPEEVTLHSRWLATGAGRADARFRNGDLTVEVTASECWDTSFGRVYYGDSASWLPTEGAVEACAYADASMP